MNFELVPLSDFEPSDCEKDDKKVGFCESTKRRRRKRLAETEVEDIYRESVRKQVKRPKPSQPSHTLGIEANKGYKSPITDVASGKNFPIERQSLLQPSNSYTEYMGRNEKSGGQVNIFQVKKVCTYFNNFFVRAGG